MRRIVFTADKGGVGKTTTVANVAVRLSLLGKRVLVVDMDGQGDATYAILGARPPIKQRGKTTHPSMYALIMEEAAFREIVVRAPRYRQIDVLPANKDLDLAPLVLANKPGGNIILKETLDELPEDAYDYALIDTAKGRDLLLINAVAAAHHAVVMVTPGTLELDAAGRTIEHVAAVRTKTLQGGKYPTVLGILMTRAALRGDDTETLSIAALRTLEESHPGLAFKTVIPESVDYRKAISQALSIYEYEARKRPEDADGGQYTARGRRLAEAYEQLVAEIISRGGTQS